MSDIVDEIDALVDEQLSGYNQRTGYDYNASQDRCWHCSRDWHGLRITARMEGMRQAYLQEVHRLEYLGEGETGYAESVIDPDYRHADDDSEILCPGSSFIGPWATKGQIDRMRTARFLGDTPSNPWMHVRASSEQIDNNSWTLAELDFARRNYAIPVRYVLGVSEPGERVPSYSPLRLLVRGDRVGFESTNGFRQESVVVDVVERGSTTEYMTEDPRYSARARQLARERERSRAREAAIRGAESSQVIIDEGRPYTYGEDFSFAHQATPPEFQHPREWPDYMGALQSMLAWSNPFLVDEVRRARFTPFSDLWTLPDDPFDPAAWTISVGNPEPDTRTPQERALPRPSTTPPFWARDVGTQRRTRTNSRRRHR